ncbi:MAG: hypothetical protein QOI10_3077 [Solirubrobacterales bacterium]|jgi:hypothetical protein|nr:hypothetical protein [Solirubrobacterales bacterium]
MVFSSIGALIGMALLFGGLALIAVHAFARDDDGFYTSDAEQLHSAGYALTTDELNLDFVDDLPDDLLGTLRVRAESTGARPLFIGIGPTADVQRYLGRVAHSQLTDWRHHRAVFTEIAGGPPGSPPGAQRFWVARSHGFGERQIDWDPEAGVWTAVAMNASGARDVAVAAKIGAKVDWLIWLGVGFTALGLVLSAGGAILILVIGRRASRDRVPAPA